ncbi:hypothetical protein K0M31_019437 [Melipona bicolor]|uniref:Uncharacterized protein n=1 Tax=Melipona bicolor TaxID=60889 RepID=A0AA40G2E2_9HYME|nr:hypothetical protein K0M31_019437 [Melipona bicolor]
MEKIAAHGPNIIDHDKGQARAVARATFSKTRPPQTRGPDIVRPFTPRFCQIRTVRAPFIEDPQHTAGRLVVDSAGREEFFRFHGDREATGCLEIERRAVDAEGNGNSGCRRRLTFLHDAAVAARCSFHHEPFAADRKKTNSRRVPT